MKKQLILAIAATAFMFGLLPAANASNSDRQNILAALKTYERALNTSDVTSILKVYSKKGVFMAPHHRSAVGINKIKTAYEGVFKQINLDITFDLAEIEVIADRWAFVRTNSTGTIKIKATGDKFVKGHQELFLFKKNNSGQWQIARYSFSGTDPLPVSPNGRKK